MTSRHLLQPQPLHDCNLGHCLVLSPPSAVLLTLMDLHITTGSKKLLPLPGTLCERLCFSRMPPVNLYLMFPNYLARTDEFADPSLSQPSFPFPAALVFPIQSIT